MTAYAQWYLLNQTPPYTPASWRGGWDLDGTTTLALDPIKFGFGGANGGTRAETSATSPFRVGCLRVVSRRLKAQTISGTVDMVVGVLESNIAADFYTRLHLYVVDTRDGSVLGTLLNGYEESAGGGGTEWPTTGTGRGLQAAQALTTVIVPDSTNYRLVAEFGYVAYNTSTTSRSGTVRANAVNANLTLMPDLTVGSTAVTTSAGYLLFSTPVEMADDVVPNVSPQTATIIQTSLPQTLVQAGITDGGFTYRVWFVYTPILGACEPTVLSVLPTGAAPYTPGVLNVFQGLSSSNIVGGVPVQTPAQFPVTVGNDYYIQINGVGTQDPATLTLSVQGAPRNSVATGGIFVNDDSPPFPAVVLSPADGSVQDFIPGFPPGEGGDILEDGTILAADSFNNVLKLFDSTFTLLLTIAPGIGFGSAVRAQRTLNRFYVGNQASPAVARVFNAAGTLLSTHTLTGNNDTDGVAANNAGTVLYHARSTGNPIRRWDLIGNTNLTDLVAGVAGITAGFDILVLKDDTIVTTFVTAATGALTVRQYQPDGTLLNAYVIAASTLLPSGTQPRLAYALDDPASFWVWFHLTGASAGISRFQNIRISDGAILTSVDSTEYEVGSYNGPIPFNGNRFGNSFSCFFLVLPMSVTDCGGVTPPIIPPCPLELTAPDSGGGLGCVL